MNLSSDKIQARLIGLAALMLGSFSLALSLSPAVRTHTWQADFRWQHWLAYLVWLVLMVWLHRSTTRYLPERDPILLPVVGLLSGWGLLTIWRLYPSFGLRQTIWLAAAAGACIAAVRLPDQLALLRRYKYVWLTGGLALTGLTILFGTNPASASGPRLWLGCCGVYFQPSEPLKLLLVIYLAAFLADRQPFFTLAPIRGGNLPSGERPVSLFPLIAPTLAMTGLTLLLLLVQRDLGTAAIFIFLFATIVYLATGRLSVVAAGVLVLVVSGVAGYALFDVVRIRVDAWLNPWLDASGRSFQIVQSLLAVANGGLAGRGPGLGSPGLVPIPHSDFIFTAIAEEGGLAGGLGLILLYALLAARGLRIAARASDSFRRFLAAGLTAYLVAQSVLIIGGNLRLLPLTGVTLPFVSYGGSSLLTAFLAFLILLLVSNRDPDQPGNPTGLRPYRQLGGFLFLGLLAVALVDGWWALARSPELLERNDNFRRTIADRYVRRGALLDRHNQVLAETQGTPEDFSRRALYPDLGSVLGYNHPVYGQSGLEASLDPYLRGLRGYPAAVVWWNNLLYGQPPPGLDVRLSLDLDLQRLADSLLDRHAGALVLLNAESGEVLAMASHPTFDPNRLDETWESLISNPGAPLVNRATQGQYRPGSALGVFLLAAASAKGELPALPENLSAFLDGRTLSCAGLPSDSNWGAVIAAGCPAPQSALSSAVGVDGVLKLYSDLGLYAAPAFELPSAGMQAPAVFTDTQRAMLGLAEISVSPLQMALAAATLSNDGARPAPRIAMAVDLPDQGWTGLPPQGNSTQVFQPGIAQSVAGALAVEGLPLWGSTASAPGSGDLTFTWHLAGTLPSWSGAPLALAVLLEEDNPSLAADIGNQVMEAALQP